MVTITPVPGDAELPIALAAVDALDIVSVCDNVTDVLLTDQGPARRFRPPATDPPLVDAPLLTGGTAADPPSAQHGFSSLVTAQRGGRTLSVLFDTGATPDGCVDNLRRMGIDPASIDVVVLSHGHYDHVTGLSGLAPILGPRHTPVVIHPDGLRSRRFRVGEHERRLAHLDAEAVSAAGFDLHTPDGPTLLGDPDGPQMVLTGPVERLTDFEPGLPGQEALVDGTWQPDAEMHDDQALLARVADRGLAVLTGCGHAGVVNIAHWARALTGEERIHALLGGFHLGGPGFADAIDPTVLALSVLEPEVVVPTHCTGWRAAGAIAEALPEAFIANSVGTTYHLTAP